MKSDAKNIRARVRLYTLLCTCLTFFFTFNVWAANVEVSQIVGVWLTEDEDAKVEIFKDDGRYYGKIIWSEKVESGEESRFDENNPEEELREREIIGLQILTGFEKTGKNEWENGKIYDPESGNTYSCVIKLNPKNQTLKVRGYMGFSLIGRTTVWKRFVENPKD